jgi:hypothetical protein
MWQLYQQRQQGQEKAEDALGLSWQAGAGSPDSSPAHPAALQHQQQQMLLQQQEHGGRQDQCLAAGTT